MGLHAEILRWDKLGQIELSALVDYAREIGPDAVLKNTYCIKEDNDRSGLDDPEIVIFWMKTRGVYSRFSLEIRWETRTMVLRG
jgi:hypothetical protein